jgi:hypothetical protein
VPLLGAAFVISGMLGVFFQHFVKRPGPRR